MNSIPVSTGEIFDKLSILEIKKLNITSNIQLENISREIQLIKPSISPYLCDGYGDKLFQKIFECNQSIWLHMDQLYELHDKRIINERYASLCFEVTELNKKRAFIKRSIDDKYKSVIKEEKSYF